MRVLAKIRVGEFQIRLHNTPTDGPLDLDALHIVDRAILAAVEDLARLTA